MQMTPCMFVHLKVNMDMDVFESLLSYAGSTGSVVAGNGNALSSQVHNLFLTAATDNCIKLWDVRTDQCVRLFQVCRVGVGTCS